MPGNSFDFGNCSNDRKFSAHHYPLQNSDFVRRRRSRIFQRDDSRDRIGNEKLTYNRSEIIEISSDSDEAGPAQNHSQKNSGSSKCPGSSDVNSNNLKTEKMNSSNPGISKRTPTTGKLINSTSGRYFNKLGKIHDRNSRKNGDTDAQSVIQKTGMKRKIFQEEAPDFISLSTEEPRTKQAKLEKGRAEFGVPYTRKEARRLFEYDSFSSQIRQFYERNRQKESFLEKKLQLKQALQNAINYAAIEDSQVCLVGSSVNGFGRVTSDADFCLVIDPYEENIQNRRRIMKALYQVQQLLRRAHFIRGLQVIPAKVPILKFVDSISGMECDLNVNNLTGLRNTELLKRYAMLDQRVQPLALCVKEWAHQKKINDASQGTLNSYSICLMVVHYMQHGVNPPVLPSLQLDHPHLFSTAIPIMEVSTQASKIETYRSRNQMTLSMLLRGFFSYFVGFDFNNEVISVRLGKAMNVKHMDRPGFWREKAMKIEEPFDRTNTARAVYNTQRACEIFRRFREANDLLRSGKHLNSLIDNAPPSIRTQNSVYVLDE